MSIFKDKTLLITGGTGSFGNAVLRRFLNTDIKEIRISGPKWCSKTTTAERRAASVIKMQLPDRKLILESG